MFAVLAFGYFYHARDTCGGSRSSTLRAAAPTPHAPPFPFNLTDIWQYMLYSNEYGRQNDVEACMNFMKHMDLDDRSGGGMTA